MRKILMTVCLLWCQVVAVAADKQALVQAKIQPEQWAVNRPNELTLVLRYTHDQTPVTMTDLQEVHTQKIHLLVINEHGDDYHHIHPTPTNTPGVYQFHFTPATQDAYRFWVDIALQEQGPVDYFYTDGLATKSAFHFQLKKYDDFKLFAPGEQFNTSLSFNQDTLIANKDVMGTITVTDAKGVIVDRLQPIMGAYAHIVGFYEDGESLAHIHPHGKPQNETQRARGLLNFHFGDPQPGYLRLYSQVKIDGQEYFAQFDVQIEEPKHPSPDVN